jgi:NitT/TauT family transport system substrate-binding protein
MPVIAFVVLLLCIIAAPHHAGAQDLSFKVGTWKTAQTIQPFLYERYSPGTKVEVFPFTNPGDQKAALLAGSLDMTGTTLALAIQAASRGEPVVLVAALCNKCSALVCRKDAGLKSVADLKGKRIGYVPGTMHEILLREALTWAGLDPNKDVILVRVDFFDMGTALSKGDIDAFLSGEPLPTQAVQKGYGEIMAYPYFDDTIGPINAGMIVHKDTLAKAPGKVEGMVAAHVRATKALQADRQAWLADAAQRFGLDVLLLEGASKNMELVWDLDDTFVRQLSMLGGRMKSLGMIEKEPDYKALVDRRFVDAMRGK